MLIILNLIFGIIRPQSIMSCINPLSTINNIIRLSEKFDSLYIFNDLHKKDDLEFEFLPEHSLEYTEESTRLINYETLLKCKKLEVHTKNSISILKNYHYRKLIQNLNPDKIHICGFVTSIDILSTCIDLLQDGHKVCVYRNCCSDLTEEKQNKALDILSWLNVEIL